MEEIFGISASVIIDWAADRIQKGLSHRTMADMDSLKEILRGQFGRHKEVFLEVYRKADFQAADVMAQIIKENDPMLYRKEVLLNGDVQRDKVINLLTARGNFTQESRDYLEGRSDLSTLYALKGQFTPYYGAYDGKKALDQYVRTYHDEAFFGRCMALMALRETSYFFTAIEVSPVAKRMNFRRNCSISSRA